MIILCPPVIRQIDSMFHAVTLKRSRKIRSTSVQVLFPIHLKYKFCGFFRPVRLHAYADTMYQSAKSLYCLQKSQFFLIRNISRDLCTVDQPSVVFIDKLDSASVLLPFSKNIFVF